MAWGRKKKPPTDTPRWNQDDYHKEFAGTLETQIKQGCAPWQKSWKPGESRAPKNVQTDKPYRGGNSLYLSVTQTEKGYSDHRWATYKQISDMGGQVRKGEKSTKVLFYKLTTRSRRPRSSPARRPARPRARPSRNTRARRWCAATPCSTSNRPTA